MQEDQKQLILLSVIYRTGNDHHIGLKIEANNNPATAIDVTHKNIFGGSRKWLMGGSGSTPEWSVQSGERIAIIARYNRRVIARATFEVEASLLEECGMILWPRYTQNLTVIDQREADLVSRATQRAIDAVFSEIAEREQVL